MPVIIIVIIVLIFIAIAVVAFVMEKKRREALQKIASRLGLSYQHYDPFQFTSRYSHLNITQQGHSKKASNFITGNYRENNVIACDYLYKITSGSGKNRRTTTYHFNFYIMELPKSFPELICQPENFFQNLLGLLGFNDIDFESAEFSKAFLVKSTDKKFAYDIFHPRMMDFFLKNPHLRMEIENNTLAVEVQGQMQPENVQKNLELLIEIKNRMPEYLFKD